MANTLAASGFQPCASIGAAAPNYNLTPARILYSLTNKIAQFDPVILNSSGYIDIYTNGTTAGLYGIFMGCYYYNPSTQQVQFNKYWPGVSLGNSSYIVQAMVITDPSATFQVQVNGGPLLQSDIGWNMDVTTATTGAPNTAGISVASLVYSHQSATATLPFRIIDIVRSGITAAYDPTAANNWALVKMNASVFQTGTGQ